MRVTCNAHDRLQPWKSNPNRRGRQGTRRARATRQNRATGMRSGTRKKMETGANTSGERNAERSSERMVGMIGRSTLGGRGTGRGHAPNGGATKVATGMGGNGRQTGVSQQCRMCIIIFIYVYGIGMLCAANCSSSNLRMAPPTPTNGSP